MLVSVSPTTGQQLGSWATHSAAEVEQIVRDAHAAFTTWRRAATRCWNRSPTSSPTVVTTSPPS